MGWVVFETRLSQQSAEAAGGCSGLMGSEMGWRRLAVRRNVLKEAEANENRPKVGSCRSGQLESTGRPDRVCRSLGAGRPRDVWAGGSNDGFLDSTALLVGGWMDGWGRDMMGRIDRWTGRDVVGLRVDGCQRDVVQSSSKIASRQPSALARGT